MGQKGPYAGLWSSECISETLQMPWRTLGRQKAMSHEAELQSLHSEIDSLTANPDKMYMDRLTGLLAEAESKPRLARGFDRLFRDIF